MKRVTQVPIKLQQRFNIFFAQRMGVLMAVTVKAIQYMYGNNALSPGQIRLWFRLFAAGRNRVVDLPRHAKERTGRSPVNIQKLCTLLQADRRLTISALSQESGIPWSTCKKIVRWDLNMSRKSAKFVPHFLQPAQMQERLRASSLMLDKLRQDPHFLDSVITMDESWMYCYDPETKRQSSVWLCSGEQRPWKAMRPRTVGKLLLVSFFNHKGMVHWEYLCGTLSSDQFVIILSHLHHAISRKRGKKMLKNFTLHMDNASPHTSLPTRTFLIQSGTKVMVHPPYSPDLAPSDFWFYPRLKRPLRGKRYPNLAALEDAVDDCIADISSFEFEQCIQTMWPKRWARCVNSEGMYFEGLQ